jgi:hypothetical protein
MLVLVALIIALLLAIIDLVLPYVGRDVRFRLLPISVIIVIGVLMISSGGALR